VSRHQTPGRNRRSPSARDVRARAAGGPALVVDGHRVAASCACPRARCGS
jgi:hypothetical protein